MPSRKIDIVDGRSALDAVRRADAADEKPARTDLATAVRYLLQLLDEKAPGNSVEVLLSRYAKCLDGRQDVANRRIAELLGEDDGQEDEPGNRL